MRVGPLNCSPEYLLIIAGEPIWVLKTLMSNNPDHNRRTIRDQRTERLLAIFNQEMQEWTPAMEAACDTALKVFLGAMQPVSIDPAEFDAVMAAWPGIIGRPCYQRGDDAAVVWPKYGVFYKGNPHA